MKNRVVLMLLMLIVLSMFAGTVFADHEDGDNCWLCGHYHWGDHMCDCGACSDECNTDCYDASHCADCGACLLEEGYWCEDCMQCEQCWVDNLTHCLFCNQCSVSGYEVCENCGACEDCWVEMGTHCLYCGECFEGSENEELCQTCFGCAGCVGDICEYCNDCEDCATLAKDHHCEECGNCFDNVEQCESGALHCIECCHFCEECGECVLEDGIEICENCGLCENCCRDAAEALDCSCGEYCVESSEWEEHTCPECGIPFCSVEQCDLCELCEDCCEANSECSDGMCVEDIEYETHFCEDCGQCFHEVDMCEDCYDDGMNRCVECCEAIKEEDGEHQAKPRSAWSYNESKHYHECMFCEEYEHYTGAEQHKFNENGICTVCSYNNGSKSIITVQPKNQTATVTDIMYGDENSPLSEKNNKVIYSITAKDAQSYQWYYRYESSKWISLSGKLNEVGAKTNTVKISVPADACNCNYSFKCVVTGKDGKEYESNVARLICKHAFDYGYGRSSGAKPIYDFYFKNNTHKMLYESQGHIIPCLGDGCELYVGNKIFPHEYKTEPKVLTEKDGTLWNEYECKICGYCYTVRQKDDKMKEQIAQNPIKKITSVEIKGIDIPKTGSKPDYTCEVGSSSYALKNYANDYYANGITWYDVTEQKEINVKTGTFVAGHDYKVKIHLVSTPGYEFDEKVTGKISGNVSAVVNQNNQIVISIIFKAGNGNTYAAEEKTQEQKQAESLEVKQEKTQTVSIEKMKENLEEISLKPQAQAVQNTQTQSGEQAQQNEQKPSGEQVQTNEQTPSGEQTQSNEQVAAVEQPWSNASSWAVEELNKAKELEIIPIIFNKNDLTKNITRKEFAHVAVKLYEKVSKKKAVVALENPFKDCEDTEVLKALNVGITNGTSETTFDPDSLITREQMATMMTRALTKAGIDTTVDLAKVEKFADDAEMHERGKASIYYMSNIGIIKGMGENQFGVLGNATREQALLISERSVEKLAK